MKNMKKLNLIFVALCTLFSVYHVAAQDVTNVRVSTTDKEVLVTYDLSGEPKTAYDVQLSFRMDDGQNVQAETIKGDIGEVLPGKDKVAIWKVYEDVNGLKGGLEPIFLVKPIRIAPPAQPSAPANPAPTPTPPNNKDDRPLVDIIDEQVNGKDQVHRTGIKVSLGNSRGSVNTSAGSFSKEFSWEAGLYHRFNLNRKIYIQPEAIYHSHKYSQAIGNANIKYNHNQLRGQVLGGIKPIGLGLYFNAGLYYAYQLNGKQELNEGGNTVETEFSDFPEMNGEMEPFNKTDFGYILGGTLSFNRGGFAMSVLFSHSFDSVLNEAYYKDDAVFDGTALRHKSLHFVIQKKF